MFKSVSNNRNESIDELSKRIDVVEKERKKEEGKPRMTREEALYQMKKKAWYFHESSWYMRHNNGYDGFGCNNGVCVPECRYYPEEGRIEDEEVLSWYEKKEKEQKTPD